MGARYRNSKTGYYCSKAYAEENPDTTTKETSILGEKLLKELLDEIDSREEVLSIGREEVLRVFNKHKIYL